MNMKVLETLFSPRGRMNRRPFFLWSFGSVFGFGIFTSLFLPTVLSLNSQALLILFFILLGIAYLLLLVSIGFILPIKRLHDMDMSGWAICASFIPLVGFALILLFFIPGTRGPNCFGPDPLAKSDI